MRKPPSLLSWALVFGAGFLVGIVFSAWKLESLEKAAKPPSEDRPIASSGNDQRRIADLEKAVAANPENLRDLILLGNEYFDAGRHQKAVEIYEKALKLDPRNADVV